MRNGLDCFYLPGHELSFSPVRFLNFTDIVEVDEEESYQHLDYYP
jgi:hypothetical protein